MREYVTDPVFYKFIEDFTALKEVTPSKVQQNVAGEPYTAWVWQNKNSLDEIAGWDQAQQSFFIHKKFRADIDSAPKCGTCGKFLFDRDGFIITHESERAKAGLFCNSCFGAILRKTQPAKTEANGDAILQVIPKGSEK